MCYFITDDISHLIDTNGKSVPASLDAAFYLIAGAGVAALVAVTLSLMNVTCERRPSRQHRRRRHHSDMQLTLVNDVDDVIIDDVMMGANDDLVGPPLYEERIEE